MINPQAHPINLIHILPRIALVHDSIRAPSNRPDSATTDFSDEAPLPQ